MHGITSQGIDFIRIFITAYGNFPVGQKLIPVKLYPGLNQSQLFFGQLSGKYLSVVNAD
jgi:hypothetical protein